MAIFLTSGFGSIVDQIDAAHKQLSVWLQKNLSHLSLYVIDTVLFYCPTVKFIKILSRCADIDIEYCDIDIWIFIPDQHGMLGCIHAADL